MKKILGLVLSLTLFTIIFVHSNVIFAENITPTATSISSISSQRDLKLTRPMMKGTDVKTLQEYLKKGGYISGIVDGFFGPDTKKALMLFQKDKGLITDGYVGPKTRAFMSTSNISASLTTSVSLGSEPSVPTPCTNGNQYNTSTGKLCETTGTSPAGSAPAVSRPTGCTSTTIYSTTTGLSCITGLSPTPTIPTYITPVTGGGGSSGPSIRVINHPSILGVTVPVGGATPTSSIKTTTQYSATISWTGNPVKFTGYTEYTATITLTPRSGYTLTGVEANFFTVAGAHSTNSANSGVITAVFPATPLIQLTITNPTSLTLSKVYDGDTTATVTPGTLSGIILDEDVSIDTTIATYDTKDVGTGKTIIVSYTISGTDASKYSAPVDYVVSTGIITTLPITVTADSSQTKIYGEVDPAFTYTTPGLVVGDSLSGALGRAIGEDVNTYAITIGTLANSNYNITLVSSNFSITAKSITVTADSSQTKIYGEVDPVFTYTAPGLVGEDLLSGSLSRASGENVGNYAITIGTLANSNYDITFVSHNFSITQKQLTISSPSITLSKVYNGNTTATVTSGTLSGIVLGDDVTINTTTATYDTKHVGTGKTITVTYTITGAKAGNYFKPIDSSVSNGIITSIQLTIATPTLTTSKEYDRSTNAAVTPGSLMGVVDGGVTPSATATYDVPNIGINKTITVVYNISGTNAQDYIKPVDYIVYSGVITAKQLTIASQSLTTTKIYDGNNTAAISSVTLSGVAPTEDVSVSSAIATYDNANIGTGKTITVVYTISGVSSANYVKPVNYTTSSGAITAVQLTIANPILTTSKVYDSNTSAVVIADSLSGVLAGDTVTVSATATYDDASVGSSKPITTVYTLAGAQAGNYTKPVNDINNTGVITAIIISTAPISGVTAPVVGATPVATLADGTGYTATISWSGSPVTFASGTVYTATITLTPKTGYTLTGITANFFTVAGATATNPINSGVISAVFPITQVAVGDNFQGGKVAYVLQAGDPGYDPSTQHGLIAATSDQSTSKFWHATNAGVTGATGTALGTGAGNTTAIIALYGTESNAANLARAYNGGEYLDWYLPSKDELNKLYINKNLVGGFTTNGYWSSSEVDLTNAWNQDFSGGIQHSGNKSGPYYVRAVRSF